MCDPATALIVAATATKAVGDGMSAAQNVATARYQQNVALRNAQLDQQAAAEAQENTRLQAQRYYRQLGQTEGQQRAAMAANGVDLSTGTALQVQQDTAMIGNEDATQIYRQGAQTAKGYDISSFNDNARATAADQAAAGAKLKGVFDVANDVLGGATQFQRLKASRASS